MSRRDQAHIDTPAENLQILLNLLTEDHQRLTAKYPFYDLELFSYDPTRGRARSFVDATTFDEARNRHLPPTEYLAGDLPHWSDVRDACLSSGILEYENHDDAREQLEEAWEDARNPHGMPTYIAFDTNVFYNRIATRTIPGDFLGENAHRVPFVVSQAVREELDSQANKKYAKSDVNELRRVLSTDRLVGALTNRAQKRARLAQAALGDVNFLTRRLRAPEAEAGELPGGEENDRVIAKSYKAFGQGRYGRIVLLTSDSGMQTNAMNANLETIFLETPDLEEGPSGELDERELCSLIHDLAVRFQFLQFPGTGFTLWGDWKGKTPDQWMDDVVRIQHTGSKVAERFEQDIEAAVAVEGALEDARSRRGD